MVIHPCPSPYLRSAGVVYEKRLAEAIELVASKRDCDGLWPLETTYPGVMPVGIGEGEGQPSRWNTLRALRVLSWFQPPSANYPSAPAAAESIS
jgi:hypothetical protein